MEKAEFLEVYSSVFAPNGNILACGRDKCLELISACQEIEDSSFYYGNKNTGYLDVTAIKKLVSSLSPETIFREMYLSVFDASGNQICYDHDKLTDLAIACKKINPDSLSDSCESNLILDCAKKLYSKLFPEL